MTQREASNLIRSHFDPEPGVRSNRLACGLSNRPLTMKRDCNPKLMFLATLFGLVRRILERLTECRYRLVEVALLLKNCTQRVVSFRIIRLRFYGSTESGGRFRQLRLL